jgi:hypothetical protein
MRQVGDVWKDETNTEAGDGGLGKGGASAAALMFHHPSFQPRPVRPGGATGASSQEAFDDAEAPSRSTGAALLAGEQAVSPWPAIPPACAASPSRALPYIAALSM